MKKILVIGIKGMAGHVIFKYLKNTAKYQVDGIARNIEASANVFNLDVSETEELKTIIKRESYDTVINCIGILNKDAEDHPAKAIWFNSYFPHFLEEITSDSTTKVIHISTDCVFNGKKGNYAETDNKDGEGFYAQSKALGELNNTKDLTIRTSIIGPDLNKNGIGLFNWFMAQTGEINGFTTAIWSGITTIELAKSIKFVIENPINGLVHITNGVAINKFDLISLFKAAFEKNTLAIRAYEGKTVNKSFQKSARLDYKVPSYEEMVHEMKNWIESEKIYSY